MSFPSSLAIKRGAFSSHSKEKPCSSQSETKAPSSKVLLAPANFGCLISVLVTANTSQLTYTSSVVLAMILKAVQALST